MRFERVAVIGVGLIGGSFALALKQAARPAPRRRRRAAAAPNLDARAASAASIDAIAPDAASRGARRRSGAGRRAGRAVPDDLLASCNGTRPKRSITDAGSTKRDVVAAARAALGDGIAQFVPAHPVAGAEKSGAAAASAELFRDRRVVLTPLPENPPRRVEHVQSAWAGVRRARHAACAGRARRGARRGEPPAARARVRAGARHRRRGERRAAFLLRRRRLPRLHAHRLQPSRDVARHLRRQPRPAARRADALQRRSSSRLQKLLEAATAPRWRSSSREARERARSNGLQVLELKPARRARGTVRLPGSKSISNRVLLLAALAAGETEVSGLLDADDTRVMREALAASA